MLNFGQLWSTLIKCWSILTNLSSFAKFCPILGPLENINRGKTEPLGRQGGLLEHLGAAMGSKDLQRGVPGRPSGQLEEVTGCHERPSLWPRDAKWEPRQAQRGPRWPVEGTQVCPKWIWPWAKYKIEKLQNHWFSLSKWLGRHHRITQFRLILDKVVQFWSILDQFA